MADYKISLGVDVDVSDIQSQINTKAKNLDGIPIKVEIENLKELKSQIQDLGKDNKNALTLDTSSIEKSLDRLSNTITDIKTSLGTLDDKSGMKSLLSSVNQIATALGKVENESDNLVKSLSALSKKDFSINFGIKLGGNSVKNNADYGDFARDVISKFELQAKHIDEAIKEQYSKIGKRLGSKANDYSGSAISQLMVDAFGYNNYDEYTSKFNGMYDKKNMSNQLAGWKNYFSLIEEAAQKMGIELSSTMNGFSADKYIQEAREIRSGTKETTDQIQTLKNVIGSGIDAQGLSTALESITQDLKVISEFIDKLSKNNSIDGLTASFDRLSKALEPLTANFKNIQDIINTEFTSANTGIKTENIIPDSGEVVKAAEQVGKKIGEGIENAVEQSLDIDDVIDEQVMKLMASQNVVGGKNSQAFKDVKKAFLDYRDEQLGKEIKSDSIYGSYSTASGIEKLTSELAKHKKVSDETIQSRKDLDAVIKQANRDAKDGFKIRISDDAISELGDDFIDLRRGLGNAFTGSGDHTSFLEYINEINNGVIDTTKSEAEIIRQVVNMRRSIKAEAKGIFTDSDLIDRREISVDDVRFEADAAINEIAKTEQKLAQSSAESANTIKQNQQEIRQEYDKTLAANRQRLDEIDKQVDEYSRYMNDPEINEKDKMGYKSAISILRQEQEELLSEINQIDAALSTLGNVDAGFEDTKSDVKEMNIAIGNAEGEVSNLESALRKIGVSDENIEVITNKLEELGITAKNVTATLRADDSISFGIKGIDNDGDSVGVKGRIDSEGLIGGFDETISRKVDETEKSFKRMKSLAKEMGQIDIKLAGLDVDKDIDEIRSLQRVLDGLESEYNELYATTAKDLNADQIKELDQIFANTTGEIRDFKNELAEASNAQELTSGFERLKSITKEIASLKIDIFKFEDADNIERASNRLNELENEAAELRAELQRKFNITSFDEIDDIAAKGEKALSDLVSKVAEARNKLAEKIKIDIELGNYEDDLTSMNAKLDKLSSKPPELSAALTDVKIAFEKLNKASELNADGAVDTERLIQAQKDYAAAIERTNNLINKQARVEAKEARDLQLQDNREVFQAKIDAWMTKNSAATKKFGAQLLDLRAKAEKADQVTLNHLNKQLMKVDKQAEKAGLKMQSLGDRIKDKAKEYMAYFSVAEVFMELYQAMKRMFDTVVEIDTAMTGLYRVTDLTASQYDSLFNEMISSAKEYGATLNDIINATTDWVRAGFDADTALGLAEVTTMYQHISDLDYDTAAENLITAYNGFKDELNGAFDGDQVAAVNYIADIFNELDNNFAVTSAGLGEALTRSASALDLAGNSIQETAGMITGIVEVTQDPEKAGSALKVLSLRLRGMKGQLEELGEETDENVENISKMQGQILNMTKGKVNIFDGAGNFKSTYEIMKGIAEVWDDLSSIDQANLLETIAGKNRANDVASLLANWQNVEAAVKSASEAEGSAARENAKYVDSLQGRLDKLTTAWQSFANTFMNSDFLKGGISVLTTFVEILEGLIDKIGALGTIGLGAGIFSMFKNKGLFSGILGDLSVLPSLFADAWKSGDNLINKFKGVGSAAGQAGGSIVKRFSGSLSGMIGGIGLAVTALALLYDWYKKDKEAAAELRQKTIKTSDAFLDSASSFEQAYIKYSGRTDLTSEEEAELESAIKGTVDALGDKSSALQKVVDGSNDYLTSLEQISRAEREAANDAAIDKLDAAEKELKEAAIGWESWDGSEVNIGLHTADKEAQKIAKEMGSEFVETSLVSIARSPKAVENVALRLSGEADAEEIVKYYNFLKDYKKELTDAELTDTDTYEKVNAAIDKMTESIGVYVDGVYEAEKAQYQLAKGYPTTTEEYLNMRESILGGMGDMSFDTRKSVASSLDSEYSQMFDLTSSNAQARKLIGVLDEYGSNEAGQIETFLNMRTAINNNECTVGDYVSQFDDINTMTKDWSDEAKEELNTSFGLDTDTIKSQYDDVVKNYMRTIKNEFSDEGLGNLTGVQENFEKFLDGLSRYELSALVSFESEIDWGKDSFDEILKQIEEEAKLIEAISFSINLELEAEKLENLTTAVSESISGVGLGNESISLVEDMFGDLDSYDQTALFERTANGIRLNSDELRRLNDEYKKTNVDGLNDKVDALGERYLQTREELSNLTYGTDEYNQKARELSDIEAQINATEKLAAQYEGLTSAYQTWQRTESAGSQRDMYESIISGFENVDDEMSRGWLDDGTIEFLRLIKGDTLSAVATTKELKEAYASLDDTIAGTKYSIRDFFTVDEDGNSTNTGVYNFLEAVEDFEGKLGNVIKRENGKIVSFDFNVAGGDEAIAKTLGISEELVQIMKRAADDAGFVVSMDGTYQQLDILKEKAQEAANKLKDTFKKTEFAFDLNTGSKDSVLKQYQEAMKIWEEFAKNKNKDGTIDMTVKGAEEAYTLVSTLQSMVDKLSEPVYMELDASQVEKDMQTPLSKLQEYETLVQAEHQLQLKGTDTTEIENSKKEILDYFENLDPEIKANLGIKNLSREEIQKKVEAGEIEIPATIDLQVEMNNTLRDMVNVALYNAGLIDKEELEARVDIKLYADKIDTSDVEEKTEESVEGDVGEYSKGKTKKEVRTDVEVKAGKVDTSDVEEKVKGALDKDGERATEKREHNIKIIAKTMGVDDVDDLESKLKGLDDKTIQAIAEVLGRADVDQLKQEMATLDPVKVQAIAEAIGKGDVEGLKKSINSLEPNQVDAIARALGYKDVNDLNAAVEGMDGNIVQAVAQALGFADINTLQAVINGMQGNTLDVEANTDGQVGKLNTLQGEIDGMHGTTVDIVINTIKNTFENTIKNGASAGKKALENRGLSPVNGTANVNGTVGRAFKQGSWGTKNSGTALVGELGREILVRDGRYYTIGDNGAEFIRYKKGDIIFNHVQSDELFRNGKVTSGGGRARAFVNGTAFADGTDDPMDKVGGNSVGSEDKFEDVIDWIEVILDRVERSIDKFEQQTNNIYKNWSYRNKALANEISEIGEEISLQKQAKNAYEAEANNVGLSGYWVDKVRNGSISIDDENDFDEDTAKKIKEYQEWYEKALDCEQAILKLQEAESALYKQRFDNVATQYEGILSVVEHEKNMLEEYISQSEAQAWLVSSKYYDALAKNERENISKLQEEKNALISEFNTAMNSGKIDKYSEAWYEMVNAIDDVTLAITEGETALLEYAQTIQQLKWEQFDLLQDRISSITEETEFLIELMSSDKLFEDNGKLTDSGKATMGQHGVAYNTYMYQADLAAAEAERIKKEMAKDPYDTELEERYREMISLQQEYILSAQDEKEAIRDLVEEGIELELDALQELIDKKNEALESERDLYEYQKKVKEQTEEIASLEKQMAAYAGDDSEEARAKIQELKVSLEDAKADLEETEYDKYISDTQKILDDLYLEYEEILNMRLDNVDALLSDMIVEINTDASTISSTLSEKADQVGYTLSESMTTIWDTNSTKINGVITTYGDKFTSAQTTTNTALGNINNSLQAMLNYLDKKAATNVKNASNSSAANPPKSNTPNTPSTPSAKPSGGDGKPKVGDKVTFVSGQYYYSSDGFNPVGSKHRGQQVYITKIEDESWATHPYHISTGNKLGSGDLGWLKLSQLSGYATGKKNFLNDEVAWTQENGLEEYIVRPSDGAILTPIARKGSVLNAQASNNLWNMTNSPAEFIKDNLNLGNTNVPNNSNVQSSYVQNFENITFSLPNVHGYNDLLREMQSDPKFEKLILAMTVDRIAGKSSLAKGKAIR